MLRERDEAIQECNRRLDAQEFVLARADHHLPPRRASEHFKAGPRPLLVASYCALWQLLAARTEARPSVFCCGLNVHGTLIFECSYLFV